MADDKKEDPVLTTKEAVSALTAAGGGAATALLLTGASTTATAIGAVITAILPTALASLTAAGARMLRARTASYYDTLVDQWRDDSSMTREEAASKLEAAKEDANVADAIWRAVRGLMDAPNNAAAVPLGLLTAEYTRDRRPADAFFRGVVRLFTELSVEETDGLRSLLDWVACHTAREAIVLTSYRGAVITKLDQFADDGESNLSESEKHAQTDVVSDPERLFAVLTGSHIAAAHSTPRWDINLPEIKFRRDTVERLRQILRKP